MSEAAAFLRMIADHPDDDAPRLVFADWLDEHDQPERAEFIRVECELEHLAADDPRGGPLAARSRVLLRSHGADWLGSMRGRNARCRFRRGFVEEVDMDATGFPAHVDDLFALPLRRLTLRAHDGKFPAATLAGCPELARLNDLEIIGDLRSDSLSAVLTSPHLAGLRGLQVSSIRLGNEGVASLLAAGIPAVQRLDLSYTHMTAAGVEAVTNWPGRAGVTSLTLSDNVLGSAGIRALAGWPTGLRRLAVSTCGLGSLGVAELGRQPWLAGLDELELRNNAIGSTGLREFLPPLPGVSVLNLGRNDLTSRAATALAAWSGLARVRQLNICENTFMTEDHEAIVSALGSARLTELRLGPITFTGLRVWGASPAVSALRELHLVGTLDEHAVRALLDAPRLPSWCLIRLRSAGRNEAALAALRTRFDVRE